MGGGIIILGVRFIPLKLWTPAGHGGVFAVLCCPGIRPVWAEYPHGGYNATPAPNRAHSGSQGEARGVFTA